MTVITRVTSENPRAALTQLLTAPLGLDIWEVRPDHLVVRTTDAQATRLEQLGYTVEQLHQTEDYVSDFASDEAAVGYHSAQSLEDDLRELAARRPDIAELHEIGRSVENRPLWALRLGNSHGTGPKVAFLGCHHAREWISVEVPYLLAADLVEHADDDPVGGWLATGEIWLAPMVNPDGHEYTRNHDRLWRKNRRPHADGTVGVDPNRNYGYMWGTLDVSTSSHVPSDETYVGPRAFSEPETRAVRDLVAREGFDGVVTYHSYSQLILYPWGYTAHPIPDPAERQRFEDLATSMQMLIRQTHGEEYTVERSSQLYPTAGDTTDWTYGEYDIPSLTVELRPATQAEGGFILPATQIVPTFEENLPAAREFVRHTFEGKQ